MNISKEEFKLLRRNYADDLISSVNNEGIDPEHIKYLLASMESNGSWQEVDYNDRKIADDWSPKIHFVGHLHDLVYAYRKPQSEFYNNKELLDKIMLSIDFFLNTKSESDNWWHNMIGIPAYFLGPVLILMYDELTDTEKKLGLPWMEQSKTKEFKNWRGGGNCIYDCKAAFNLAVFEENTELLSRIFDENLFKYAAFTGEADPVPIHSPASGIKEDYSHWEHGNLMFNHGYGSLLASELTKLVKYTIGTSIQINQNGIDFIANYVLDGGQWMERGGWLSFDACGRGISRPADTLNYLETAAKNLVMIGAHRKDELIALASRNTENGKMLNGNRMFYISDYMAHHRDGYFASVRMVSNRTLSTEDCNWENIQGQHLADGASYLVLNGDEYSDIQPVWDWHRIPGTTITRGEFLPQPKGTAPSQKVCAWEVIDRKLEVPSGKDTPNGDLHLLPQVYQFPEIECTPYMDNKGWLTVKRWGKTTFAGGVSDGRYGAAAYDLNVLSLKAKKSWFFFDNYYVCLGAGIYDCVDSQVFTTINQCRLNGDVYYIKNGNSILLNKGEHTLQAPCTIWHDNVAYFVNDNCNVVCHNTNKSGNWHSINLSIDEQKEMDVFLLGIDHGTKPENDTYSYTVYPGITLDRAELEMQDNITVLNNTYRLQAVYDEYSKLTQIAFYENGEIATNDNIRIAVERPCMVMMDQVNNTLCVADPDREQNTLNVFVNGRRYEFHLKNGKSETIMLDK